MAFYERFGFVKKEKYDELLAINRDLVANSDVIKVSNDELRQQLRDLEEKCNDYRKEYEELKTCLDNMNSSIKIMEEDMKKADDRVDDAIKELADKDKEIARLQDTAKSLASANDSLTQDKEELQKIISDQSKQYANFLKSKTESEEEPVEETTSSCDVRNYLFPDDVEFLLSVVNTKQKNLRKTTKNYNEIIIQLATVYAHLKSLYDDVYAKSNENP